MKTKVIKWSVEDGYREQDLEKACQVIEAGGLVAFPTETVYGLGGDGLQPEASKKIYAAKGRPSDNPLILHIGSWEQLDEIVADVPKIAKQLADEFWPGPLTMIFRKSDKVPYETTGGMDTVAVRMPEHLGALAFLKKVQVPIAAPSANTSGRPSPTLAKHVEEDLSGKIDMIIDGGEVGIGYESTIVDLTETTPIILRPGYITKEMLEGVIGEVVMDPALMSVQSDVKPKAPGMKYRHYAPEAMMTVYQGKIQEVVQNIRQQVQAYIQSGEYKESEIGILTTIESKDNYPQGCVIAAGSREADTVGRYLYGALREFDEKKVKLILAESFFELSDCDAIMNRLLKAAGQNIVSVSTEDGGQGMEYNRIIFVSKENITLGPMAEWMLKSILMDKDHEVLSRGLVVLFPEPRSMKVTDILMNHSIPCEEQVSEEFKPDEVTEDTLVITMTFAEKVVVLEKEGMEDANVFTIKEFAEEEGEMETPVGGDGEEYEASYVELKDLLYKIKKKLGWN